jgi:hypothetical protein
MRAGLEVDPGRDPDGRLSAVRQVSEILADAARAGWHDRGRILGIAIAVSLCTAGADIIADHLFDPSNKVLSVVGTLSVEVISLFGTILISGFLCRLIGQDRYDEGQPARSAPAPDEPAPARSGEGGHSEDRARAHRPSADQPTPGQPTPDQATPSPASPSPATPSPAGPSQAAPDRATPDRATSSQAGSGQAAADQPVEDPVTVGHVVRTLPWVRLAVADVIAAVLIGVGLLLLVIPGLVVLNFLAVLGPVIEIERRTVLAALRRSMRLVRQHFWWVAVLITVPAVALGELESILPDPHSLRQILEFLAVRGLGEALVQTAIALVVVEVCFWLIDLDARRHPPAD